MILLAVTFRLLDAIRLFDTIFMMTGGGPGTQTYTASYYLYTVGFTQFHLSQATAGSWIFLVFTAARRDAPRPAPAPHGGRADGRPRHRPPPRAASIPIGRILLLGFFLAFVLAAALLDGQHLDQAERRLPRDPAGLVPRRSRRIVHYTAALFAYRGLEGLINSLIVSICGHHALGAARHADGLQPRALQHRRPAPLLLGAVAALPAADRASSCRSS